MENEVQNTPTPESQIAFQETTQSPTQTPEAPKQKFWLVVGMVLLVLFLLGTTGFFAYQNYQLKQQVQQKPPTPLPEVTRQLEIPSPTPTEDSTSSWKVYSSQTYSYTIKYPSSWYLYEPETITAYSKNTVGFWPEKGEGEILGIWVTIRDDRFSFTDLDSWWEQYKKRMITPIDEGAIEEKKYLEENFDDLIKTEKIVISGQPALRVETIKDYQSRPFRSVFVINKKNEIFDINTNITTSSNPYFIYFDQMLSTFKFTD